MATFAVHVAMGEFFLAGITHIDHLDLEVQALAGQRLTSSPSRSRMVTICIWPSGAEAWNCMPTSSWSTPSNMLRFRVLTSSAMYSP